MLGQERFRKKYPPPQKKENPPPYHVPVTRTAKQKEALSLRSNEPTQTIRRLLSSLLLTGAPPHITGTSLAAHCIVPSVLLLKSFSNVLFNQKRRCFPEV